jgi:hypothetical protein
LQSSTSVSDLTKPHSSSCMASRQLRVCFGFQTFPWSRVQMFYHGLPISFFSSLT